MPRYALRWRQLVNEDVGSTFVIQLAYGPNRRSIAYIAASVAGLAWNREFQVAVKDGEEFTTLHRIEDWAGGSTRLPTRDPASVWRRDLQRDLVADRLVDAVRRATAAAVAARVLLRSDGDALIRFTLDALLRPRL